MNSGYDEQIQNAKKVLQGTPEAMGGTKTATSHEDLIRDVLDPRVPKSERENAAAREIERLQKDAERLKKTSQNLLMQMLDEIRRGDRLADTLEEIANLPDVRCDEAPFLARKALA